MKGVRGIFRKDKKDKSAEAEGDASGGNEDDEDDKDATADFLPQGRAARRAQREAQRAKRDAQKEEAARPSYRVYAGEGAEDGSVSDGGDGHDSDLDDGSLQDNNDDDQSTGDDLLPDQESQARISKSAGALRLGRILTQHDITDQEEDPAQNFLFNRGGHTTSLTEKQQHFTVERIGDPKNLSQVANFAARVVVPPLKVDPYSIGGPLLADSNYSDNFLQEETLLCFKVQNFESTGEIIPMSLLQYPADFKTHKRSWGGFYGASGGAKARSKLRYVCIVRSTNQPLSGKRSTKLQKQLQQNQNQQQQQQQQNQDGEERGDYDQMFAPETSQDDGDLNILDSPQKNSSTGMSENRRASMTDNIPAPPTSADTNTAATTSLQQQSDQLDELAAEISSFPALMCMSLHSSGTAPDIRKLIRLDQLTTVQDLHTTVVQLGFRNGDTVRLDFGSSASSNNNNNSDNNNSLRALAKHNQTPESDTVASLDKERFIWSLLQVHAMLCVSVVELNANHTERTFLPPLQVRNLDRAELQYVATVNGFLRQSEALTILLERHKQSLQADMAATGTVLTTVPEEKVDLEEIDSMAYDLMMGNFATRITLFQSEEERRDSEEILNSIDEWKGEQQAQALAERLGHKLQSRMRDLEAETCRRLIAWEDEKQGGGEQKDDGVDALALETLFTTLETLDKELQQMEEWLQDRAATIKPLTDDCADIEEENRQLEQQWKSYEMLGSEIRRLLIGLDIDQDLERVLRNPAQALVYDEDGLVDVEESEHGVEQIYEAGKALQEAIEYPRKTGGMHLRPVNERAKGLTTISSGFCKALAQIIVTVMEQFKTEVVAGSDYGKVSKSDTHATIARKIRDTQRKFQSALLGYLKLIEVLAALNPEMLPALRDAYAEMVAEGILMKKRMKGYFQALPAKNSAYLNRSGKDLKEYYVPLDGPIKYESVNAPDIKAALTELFPVIAREAYFTSALFGTSTKEQDGREKKRNFENAKAAVDHSSQHFRYYIHRTCGIQASDQDSKTENAPRGDPLLCLVASIYLNEVMDNYVDREKKGGDHSLSLAYVRATILDLRKKADKQWVLWVEKQIDWIRTHDGVPLHGKRAGVFPSFERFPLYLDHVLSCCREGRGEEYTPDMASIKVVNYYMQKMAAALLDSLRECALRETTDKQYASTVMQMENTYHFTQSIKERGPALEAMFAKQITKANAICKESTDGYLGWMIKREFTVLHELFSRVSKMRKDVGDTEVAKNIPKHLFVRTLTKEANREILKEKIGAMFARMEKHLSEDGKLLPVAWKALVKVLYEWFGRWEKLSSAIYRHKLDPGPVDVVRIAKAAGGGAKPKPQNTGSEFAFKSILALGNKGKEGEP